MGCLHTWHKELIARVTLLLSLLCFALGPRAAGQGIPDGKQSPPAAAKAPEDLSKWPSLVMAVEGGSGWSSPPGGSAAAYGGIKLGAGGIALDLGYDRLRARSGFAAELSGMLPLFRLPGPQKDETKNYL